LITKEDVLELIQRAQEPPVVVIAPDRHGRGTNALLISPPGLIEYDFGENSFQRHCKRAKQAGARLEVVELPSLGLDLDIPEDFELIKSLESTITF
jgi:2-phospho-L-lactate guanylyltransferase